MSANLPADLKITPGPYPHKYTAKFTAGGRGRTVHFGDQRYQQYHDMLGKYRHMDHNDCRRWLSYQARHGGVQNAQGDAAIKQRLSASWFADKFLWPDLGRCKKKRV